MNKKFTLTFALLSLLAVGNAHADSKLVAVDSPSATTLASFSLSDISKPLLMIKQRFTMIWL